MLDTRTHYSYVTKRAGLDISVERERARISPLGHFGPSGFEDFAFSFGKALDAVSGDLIEDGIDFPGNEFLRREFRFRRGLAGPFVRLAGVDEDFGFAEDVGDLGHLPFPFDVAEPADKGVAEHEAAKMSTVRTEALAASGCEYKKSAEAERDVEKDFGRETQHKEQINILVRIQEAESGE